MRASDVACVSTKDGLLAFLITLEERANGERYPRVDGARERHFAGTSLEPHKLPEKRGDSHPSGARCVGRMDLLNYTRSGAFSKHFLQTPFSNWGGSALGQVHF